ncbi:hypothetical protein GCM10027454_18710 [Algoriphagus aestuariicola]
MKVEISAYAYSIQFSASLFVFKSKITLTLNPKIQFISDKGKNIGFLGVLDMGIVKNISINYHKQPAFAIYWRLK